MFGPHFTRDNAMTMAFAYDEAAQLAGENTGRTELGNDHLILGMLCNARAPIFGVLTDAGLTLDRAREAARTYRRQADADAGERAQAQERETEGARVGEDRAALAAIGIDLDKVVAAVKARFGDDITDGWALRPNERRERRGGGRGGRGTDSRDADNRDGLRGDRHGYGRRGPHGARGRGGREFGFPGGFPGFDDQGPGVGPWGGPEFGGRDGDRSRGRRGPRPRGFGRPRFSADAKAALAYAVEFVRSANAESLTAEHVLRGILKVDDAASRAVIASATTSEELLAALDADSSPNWGSSEPGDDQSTGSSD